MGRLNTSLVGIELDQRICAMDATQVDEEVIHTIVIIALVYYNTRILYNERVKE